MYKQPHGITQEISQLLLEYAHTGRGTNLIKGECTVNICFTKPSFFKY